ncbi:head completion adaptor [Vibrio phage 2.117.O._10N.261.45.E9]|nr:head completion adaptor [Vibrio phage 1.117.O._10N.261.45.E9]AUR95434.1 head completion adaptor [Vibrio phage 1.207.B._10N.222.51.C2]AUS02325.1 head completion adaptor [Vibrio phage 2.117.O._10N.261.45.E9]
MFLVEDGTGLETATAYAEVVFVTEYATRHGLSFEGEQNALENAIMVATTYADTRWGNSLKGRPLRSVQSLEFPRLGLTDRYGREEEGLPLGLKEAVAEYAITQLSSGTLYPTPPTNSPQQIKKTKTTVGPITTEKEFIGATSQASYLDFPRADYKMRKFIYPVGGGVIR